MTPLERLLQTRLVCIVRKIPVVAADVVADSLVDAGVRLLEVTMNTPGAVEIVGRWLDRIGDRALVGAGTVTDPERARAAIDAGAQFLISPNLDEDVVRLALGHGIDVWPGTQTATEMVRARRAGASAVKLFPAGALGSRYLKEILGPLDDLPIIATGGIGADNMREFLDAGAAAVGVGASLLDPTLIAEGRFDVLRDRARLVVDRARTP